MKKRQGFIPSVPAASWGAMVVLWLVFGLNMVGDGLRDALDPRLRGTMN